MSKSLFDVKEDPWSIWNAYFRQSEHVLVKHQLDSFNDFVRRVIPQIIGQNSPITAESEPTGKRTRYELHFKNVYMSRPLMQQNAQAVRVLLPNEARERNFTYMGTIYVDLEYRVMTLNADGTENSLVYSYLDTQVPLSEMPIMLQSDFCHLSDVTHRSLGEMGESLTDIGGYFLVSGNSGTSEKVIISSERMAENREFVFKPSDKESARAEVKSSIDQRFTPVRNITVKLETGKNSGSVKRINVGIPFFRKELPFAIVMMALGVTSHRDIASMVLNGLDDADEEMLNLLEPSLMYTADPDYPQVKVRVDGPDDDVDITDVEEATGPILTQDAALRYLSMYYNYRDPPASAGTAKLPKDIESTKIDLTRNALDKDFLAHMGMEDHPKAMYLAFMVRRMLECYLKRRKYDDRDHASNKRVDVSGDLMGALFRGRFMRLIKDLRKFLGKMATSDSKSYDHSIRGVLRSSSIGAGLRYGLGTGNWGSGKQVPVSSSQKGVSQELKRLSVIDTLAQTRRINTPLERAGSKLIPPRRLHGTYIGMVCPNETPEGAQVGVVKNLALMTLITIKTSSAPVELALNELGMIPLGDSRPEQYRRGIRVFLNGRMMGVLEENQAADVVHNLRLLRRNGILETFTSIAWHIEHRELRIQTDGGRYVRPLLIVENNRLIIEDRMKKDPDFTQRLRDGKIEWAELLTGMDTDEEMGDQNSAVIEYLDTNELETCMIAWSIDQLEKKDDEWLNYTHMEIHPTTMLGVLGQMIPFSDHNQSPRNCYQSSMGKQAMGVYVTNLKKRMDTMGHSLCYPERPLVSNQRTHGCLGLDKYPHGQTAIVAVACYTGYNQEDSLIINSGSVQRGLFNSLASRTYSDETRKAEPQTKFMKPSAMNTSNMGENDYTRLDERGVARLGSHVDGESNHVLIGKVIDLPPEAWTGPNKEKRYEDASTVIRSTERGVVDRVIPNENFKNNTTADDQRFARVRVTEMRLPIIGDKFASRAAQKGTAGMILPTEDMPMTANGLVPDMIMNPHAHPSRMTIAHLLEGVAGKGCALTGTFADSTPWTDLNTEQLGDILQNNGFQRYGDEVMYNGMTGEMMPVAIYITPTYYQRLKHMVDDKMHARSTGPVQSMTRQPAEGRARHGGLRLGEMERDAILAHGAARFQKEKYFDHSDAFSISVGKNEQVKVVANPEQNFFRFNGQPIAPGDVNEVDLPYACELMLKEVRAMGIGMKYDQMSSFRH